MVRGVSVQPGRHPATVRPARAEDAAVVAELTNALNRHEGRMRSPFTADLIRSDGFGANAAFSVVLAELDGAVVGYAMFHPAYNSDVAARELWLVDLFVVRAARGQGVGRALLAWVAAEAVRRGAATLSWAVQSSNVRARGFYERIGARDSDLRILELAGPSLAALAAEAAPQV